jgi:preprotein translocase subunit YajC
MIGTAWAQAAGGAAAPSPLVSMAPLVLIVVVFYFLVLRPQHQKAKEHRLILENLKRNDEVITAGGLYGKVTALTDDIVTLEIAPNVRVRVSRPQISTVISALRPDDKEKGKDKEK